MKWIAISLNLLLIVTAVYLVVTEGAPRKDEVVLAALLFAAPVSSLVALFVKGGESWLGLYFKRKALEETRKIEKLSGAE